MLAGLGLVAASSPVFSGWLVFYDDGASLKAFEAHADQLDTVGSQWFECADDGTVHYASDATTERRAKGLATAHAHHVTFMGMLANPGFSAGIVESFLADPVKRDGHAANVCAACVRDGLDGIDLDYESLKAADRDSFSALVETLAAKLHAAGKLLAVSVHPKEAEPGTWDGAQAQDWARIGKAADYVRVMGYDLHWETSDAGPIAPIEWAERLIKFGLTEVPAAKLDLGIPGYGYDWVGKRGKGIDYSDFTALTGAATAKRDPASQELVLAHGDATAWMCDAVSESPKFALAQRLGIHGLCLWQLGSMDPAFWANVPTRVRPFTSGSNARS